MPTIRATLPALSSPSRLLQQRGLGAVPAVGVSAAAARGLGPDALIELGRRNAKGRWPLDRDMARARNAHATNRPHELAAALAGDFDWLEVDVRRIDGALLASHDRTPPADALRMADWIRIGAATGRGLKLDFKDRASIAPTLDLIAAARIPDRRLVINVPVLGASGLTVAQLRRIRARFPHAVINLSIRADSYGRKQLHRAAAIAHAVGGRIAFPLDVARVDRRVIAALQAAGRIAIWNDPGRTPIRDVARLRAQLREWGVDGVIDLR